jgi:hypothetical protein
MPVEFISYHVLSPQILICELTDRVKITFLAANKSLRTTILRNRRLRESGYAEQIEKELRKSILFFPQFYHFKALRRFSRKLEGIL